MQFFLLAVAEAAKEAGEVTIARRPLQLAEEKERRKAAEQGHVDDERAATAALSDEKAAFRDARPP